MNILPKHINFDGPFPKLNRRLRLGVLGGGRVSTMQAAAARMSNHWDIVAGALSSDPVRAAAQGSDWFFSPDRSYASFEDMARIEAVRPDGIDAVMVTAPNHVHFEGAKAFIEAGIDILCDKPLTNDFSQAQELVRLSGQAGVVFGVSYVMSCFPMIRQARELVSSGAIGKINQVHVEFLQDWMTPEDVGTAEHVKWRLDPAKSGKTSCVGDIGTHAAHLASFVSGLKMTDLRAEFHVCGSPKPLEDTAFMMTRFEGGIPGTLMITRLAPGNRGGLRLRIFGSEGGLEWDLENADQLKFNRFGEADRVISRGNGHGVSPATERLIRTARGFQEGIIEAWANLYTEFAMAVAAGKDGVAIPDNWLALPSVKDGADGVRFIEATVISNDNGGSWEKI